MKELTAGQYILNKLSGCYRVTKNSIGKEGRLNKGLISLTIDTYEIQNLGHFCLLSGHVIFGLMNMETAVLAVYNKDVPLVNFDTMRIGVKKIQIIEFYDTLLEEDNPLLRMECLAIRKGDEDLEDRKSGGRLYDSKLLDYSYGKTVKASSKRTDESAKKYADAVFNELERAADCDEQAKKEKICRFAQSLIRHGGPAADTFTKLFGEEMAKRVILKHMYGCE